MIFIGELLLVEEMKPYHFIIPKGFSLYKNSSIIYQTHVTRRNTISGNHKGCPYNYDVLGFTIFLCVYEVMLDFRGLETPTSLF